MFLLNFPHPTPLSVTPWGLSFQPNFCRICKSHEVSLQLSVNQYICIYKFILTALKTKFVFQNQICIFEEKGLSREAEKERKYKSTKWLQNRKICFCIFGRSVTILFSDILRFQQTLYTSLQKFG